jgi:hypothetical protein
MNRDIGWLLAPLFALALFAFVVVQTLGALRTAGAWSTPAATAHLAPDDPMLQLANMLDDSKRPPMTSAVTRDPFALGGAPVAATSPDAHPVVRKPVVPPPPPKPVLTAIVWAAEPSALVHWKDRDWTVHPGALFDEFQVVSITRDQVVLRRGDESITLTRKPQGE